MVTSLLFIGNRDFQKSTGKAISLCHFSQVSFSGHRQAIPLADARIN